MSTRLFSFQPRNILFGLCLALAVLPLVAMQYFLKAQANMNLVMAVLLPLSFFLMLGVIAFINFRLKRYEIHINTLLNEGADLLLIFDKQGSIVRANYSALKILKYQPQERLSLNQLLGETEAAKIFRDGILKQESTIKRLRVSLLTKTSQEVWVLATIISTGGMKACIARDISLQKKLEKRLSENKRLIKGILDAVSDGILILDRDLRVQMVNQGHLDLFKLNSSDEVIGSYRLPHKQGVGQGSHQLESMVSADVQKSVDKNGNRFDYLMACCPVKDKKGNIINVIEYRKDLTTENLLHGFFSDLDETRTVKNIARDMAHELKSPVSIIKGYADLLRMKYPHEEWVKEILHESLRINNMISIVHSRGKYKSNLEQLLEETLKFILEKEELLKGFDIQRECRVSHPVLEVNPAHLKLVFTYLFNGIRQLPGNRKKPCGKIFITIERSSEGLVCFLKFPEVSSLANSRMKIVEIGVCRAREILSHYQAKIELNAQKGLVTINIPVRQELLYSSCRDKRPTIKNYKNIRGKETKETKETQRHREKNH